MGKKKRPEDPEKENSERWLLTYADMLTLLFLFFVVLYAMSQVDQKKYEELASALEGVMGGANMGYVLSTDNGKGTQGAMGERQEQKDPAKAKRAKRAAIKTELESRIKTMTQIPPVDITEVDEGLRIRLFSDVFFESGKSTLSEDATQMVVRVVEALSVFNNQIRIEGHTDSTPTDTIEYPSNWELSGARAFTVLHLFEDLGFDPMRLAAVAYADTKPVLEDQSREGRSYNRRVDIILLWDKDDY